MIMLSVMDKIESFPYFRIYFVYERTVWIRCDCVWCRYRKILSVGGEPGCVFWAGDKICSVS